MASPVADSAARPHAWGRGGWGAAPRPGNAGGAMGFAPAPRPAPDHAPASPLLPLLLKGLAVLIAALSTAASAFPPALTSLLLKVFGGGLVLTLAYLLSKRRVMPGEVRLYFSFLAWGVTISLLVAVDTAASLQMAWKIFQSGLLLWAVVVAHERHPDLRITMWGIWLIGILYIYVAYSNQAITLIDETGGRMTVMGENSNTGGQVFVFAILAALYLSERAASWRTKLPLVGSIPVLAYFLLFTGSRKMLIGMILVATLWGLTMTKGRNSPAKVVLLLALALTAYGIVGLWADTPMGQRYEYAEKDLEGREALYSDGWTLVKAHPEGIGLANQSRYMNIGEVHTEFLDVWLTTGAVGAALYFSIYLLTLRRVMRSRGMNMGFSVLDRRFFWIYMVLIFWLMFGYSRFKDPLHMVVFGSFVGIFFHIQECYGAIRKLSAPPSICGFTFPKDLHSGNAFQ
ncbi:MAG: hypothetical protein EOM72_00315 [Opitutae bacterium]|nr:hypothetical protein [Opitutae bacterium]